MPEEGPSSDSSEWPKAVEDDSFLSRFDGNNDGILTLAEFRKNTKRGPFGQATQGTREALAIVRKYAGDIKSFFSNPRRAVLGFVVTWLLQGILGGFAVVADFVLTIWGALAGIPNVLVTPLVNVLGILGGLVSGLLRIYFDLWMGLAGAAGPGAPVVLLAMGGVTWFALTGGLRLLASYVPGGSSAVGILTLRWL